MLFWKEGDVNNIATYTSLHLSSQKFRLVESFNRKVTIMISKFVFIFSQSSRKKTAGQK